MAHMTIRHKVEDFPKWKQAFDAHRPAREGVGLKDLHLWRNVDDSNEVVILFEAADVDRARDFADSTDLKEAMKGAGVIGLPDILFLDLE